MPDLTTTKKKKTGLAELKYGDVGDVSYGTTFRDFMETVGNDKYGANTAVPGTAPVGKNDTFTGPTYTGVDDGHASIKYGAYAGTSSPRSASYESAENHPTGPTNYAANTPTTTEGTTGGNAGTEKNETGPNGEWIKRNSDAGHLLSTGLFIYSDKNGGWYYQKNALSYECDYWGNPTGVVRNRDGDIVDPGENGNAAKGGGDAYEGALYGTLDAYGSMKDRAYKYAERARQLEQESAGKQRDMAYSYAEQVRRQGEKDAETARQRAVIDAASAREANRATYGANAETLGNMGLTSSGYSDYIDSQAYAAYRGEVQSANASAEKTKRALSYEEFLKKLEADQTYENTMLSSELGYNDTTYGADVSYAANSAAKNEELGKYKTDKANTEAERARSEAASKNQTYVGLLADVNNGLYTPEQARTVAESLGLDETQTAAVVAAAEGYQSKTNAAKDEERNAANVQNYMTLLDGANNGQYTPEQAKLLAESLGLTDEQINSVVAAATATTAAWAEYNGYEYGVTGTDQAYTQDEIDDMVQNGEKTAEEGMSLKATQNAKVLKVGQDYLYAFMYDSTYTYTNDAGTSVTRRLTLSDMIGYLDEVEGYYEGGYIDEATYDEIQSKFTTSNKVSGGWHVRGLGTGTDGDTIYLTVGSTEAGYEEYMLDVGQKVTDAKEQRFLNKLATGNEYHAPSIEGEKASGATNVNSGVKPGKIVVAYGKMYIYTKAKGWAEVVDYRNNGHTMKAIAEWEEYNNGKEHSAPTPKPSWGYLS